MTSKNRDVIAIFNEGDFPHGVTVKIRTGMIIAQDVYNEHGFLLCTKNSRLNENLVRLFLQNGIRWARTYEMSLTEKLEGAINEDLILSSVVQSEDFQEFKTEYVRKIDEVKEHLLDISIGGNVDIEALHEVTSDIVNTLDTKNDVFNYIRFMKQSDEATFGHCINVSMLCNLFGHWLGMKHRDIVDLTAAGSLHDLGKTKIPHSVLCKKGRLTEGEFNIVKNHTVLGYELMKDAKHIPERIKLAALMHHERPDGSGYPHGRKTSDIDKYASIVTICDIYDAMISNRCYKEKLSPFYVIKTFEQGSYGYLHTEYLLVFLQNIAHTFLHSDVVLSDGREGRVVFINEKHLSRPIIQCGREFIDLLEEPGLDVKLAM
ncbi:MAG: HD-GYP domain-containing protein [Defluviitaleaceae bacterium]|nr:HD-GYP domain-containing protein [Defluviitaleaceae bacterium]